jgi:cytochrome P450
MMRLQTVSAIRSFFLYMVLNPTVQARAQEEIDRVVSGVRLPTLADRAGLPYVEALVSEVLRLGQVAPAVARRLHVEDVHEGYFLPRGTFVVGNLWCAYLRSYVIILLMFKIKISGICCAIQKRTRTRKCSTLNVF